ncbi:4734_t:CDS:2, partial [Racocetra persica]
LGAPFSYIQWENIQVESNLAPLLSSRNAEVIPDQYIVVFKDQLPKERVEYHHNCIRSFVEEENTKLAKRGILDKLIHGITHIYDLKVLKGYAGKFTKEVLNKIRQSDEVAWVERDQV